MYVIIDKGYGPIVKKKINFTTVKLLLKVCNYNMCLGNMTQAANKLLKGGHLHLRADRPDPAQPSLTRPEPAQPSPARPASLPIVPATFMIL